MGRSKKKYVGINIQYPISELIIQGKKTVETRTYPIPTDYIGREMILIETPGESGKFKARMRAILTFTKCFPYKTETLFYADFDRHQVSKDSTWAWDPKKKKWGWDLVVKKVFKRPIAAPSRKGIVFSTRITL